MNQFSEQQGTKGKCPVCEKEVLVRSTRGDGPSYCSRVCASQRNFGKRYRGTLAGPMDRPTQVSKTKLP